MLSFFDVNISAQSLHQTDASMSIACSVLLLGQPPSPGDSAANKIKRVIPKACESDWHAGSSQNGSREFIHGLSESVSRRELCTMSPDSLHAAPDRETQASLRIADGNEGYSRPFAYKAPCQSDRPYHHHRSDVRL